MKSISLRKFWLICQKTIQAEFHPKDWEALLEAYRCVQNNPEFSELKLNLDQNLKPNDIENLQVAIEKKMDLPIKDSDFLISKKDSTEPKSSPCSLIFYLNNVRSGFNIGSIIRLADGQHIKKIYLSGYTADTSNSQVQRSALGSAEHLKIERISEDFDLIKKLKMDGYTVVALETAEPSQSLRSFSFPEKTVLMVGNEKNGIPPELLSLCDQVLHIKMFGFKNSLNIVSALSMATYEWSRQWRS